jgi:hypothetical protein
MPGEDPPGYWVPSSENPGRRRWKGEAFWSTWHGPVLLRWYKGELKAANNAVLAGADGTRGYVERTTFGPHRGWRRPESEDAPTFEGWIYGDLQLIDTDAIFVDTVEQPSPTPVVDWGYPDLEFDLFASFEFKGRLQDQGFAMALYLLWTGYGPGWWVRARGGEMWILPSWRTAAAIVANLRGRGENYLDYFLRGVPEIAEGKADSVVAAIAEIGWHPISLTEFQRRFQYTEELVTGWEQRQSPTTSIWYLDPRDPKNSTASSGVHSLIRRVEILAASGRVSKDEWSTFYRVLRGE